MVETHIVYMFQKEQKYVVEAKVLSSFVHFFCKFCLVMRLKSVSVWFMFLLGDFGGCLLVLSSFWFLCLCVCHSGGWLGRPKIAMSEGQKKVRIVHGTTSS